MVRIFAWAVLALGYIPRVLVVCFSQPARTRAQDDGEYKAGDEQEVNFADCHGTTDIKDLKDPQYWSAYAEHLRWTDWSTTHYECVVRYSWILGMWFFTSMSQEVPLAQIKAIARNEQTPLASGMGLRLVRRAQMIVRQAVEISLGISICKTVPRLWLQILNYDELDSEQQPMAMFFIMCGFLSFLAVDIGGLETVVRAWSWVRDADLFQGKTSFVDYRSGKSPLLPTDTLITHQGEVLTGEYLANLEGDALESAFPITPMKVSLSGSWQIQIRSMPGESLPFMPGESVPPNTTEFIYILEEVDGRVSGKVRAKDAPMWHSTVKGTLQGDKFEWSEEFFNGKEYRGHFAAKCSLTGGRLIDGNGTLWDGTSLQFDGTKANNEVRDVKDFEDARRTFSWYLVLYGLGCFVVFMNVLWLALHIFEDGVHWLSVAQASMDPVPDTLTCEEDAYLRHWTFLRYCVLGLICLWKVWTTYNNIRNTAQEDMPSLKSYQNHPNMVQQVKDQPKLGFIVAGFIFIQMEGLGLTLYFALSAICDNFAIFVFHNSFCQCVQAVSLYSMALISFLPTCFIALFYQDRMYDNGTWKGGSKPSFLLFMSIITILAFFIRLWIVYDLGWIDWINNNLGNGVLSLVMAAVVPPLVDGIQAFVLIESGLKSEGKVIAARQLDSELAEQDSSKYSRICC
jgi:hypothetical protein